MRRAVWRAGPNDAPDLLTYARRAVRRWGLLAFLFPLVLFGLSAVLCGPFALLGALLTSRQMALRLAALKPDELSPLLPDPPPARLFRHSVAYLDGFLVVGEDDIALSFVGGWLIGQGVRSEFALRRQDVESIAAPIHGVGFLYLKNGQCVRLHDLHAYAREALLDWLDASIPVAGEPTFPPTGVEPRQILKTQVRAITEVSLIILALPIALFVGGVAGGLGLALGGGLILFGVIRLGIDVADLCRYRSILRSEDRRAMTV